MPLPSLVMFVSKLSSTSHFHADTFGQVNDNQVTSFDYPNFLHHVAPKLVLVSALGFGCCVSSFGYRRQREDPLQVVVFTLLVGTVATVAYGVGARSNMILLGYMPLATCVAMILSMCGHAIFRLTRCQKGVEVECQEKHQLL